MKKLLPILLAILGLGAGVGAGMALKPAPMAEHAAAACVEPDAAQAAGGAPGAEGEHGAEAADCAELAAADPFAPAPAAAGEHGEGDAGPALVALERPFVVPVFGGEKVVAMVVVSVAVEMPAGNETAVEAVQPRLRDTMLAAMFRHANSGGFDGQFTTGRKMEDLRSALLAAAREVFPGKTVADVLITEIARQDV